MAKAVEPPALYVVLDSFVIQLDGAAVTFRKGDTVEAGHPVLKVRPDAFRSFVATHRAASPRIEQATAAPGEKRGA
jgi:hypothetical protein